LANDLDFEYSTNSPTMMIEGMVVAGKWLYSIKAF
jgi:PmbA protein